MEEEVTTTTVPQTPSSTTQQQSSEDSRVGMSKAPVDVQEDVRSTERRRRVSSALDCKPFRSDLETIVLQQHPGGLQEAGVQFMCAAAAAANQRPSRLMIPIDDIHRFKDQRLKMDPNEITMRCKVASLCRLIDSLSDESESFGSRLCSTHITARLNTTDEVFLVNPYGLMLSEVTARSLLKVDAAGNLINEDGSRTSPGLMKDNSGAGLIVYNRASFATHAAIHRTRCDLQCIVHVHNVAVVTVSCLKAGLMPLCREALLLGGISYHEMCCVGSESAIIDSTDRVKRILCEELGPFNKILIWRNHGMSICGDSVEDAWYSTANAIKACKVQCGAMSVGLDNLHVPSISVQKEMVEASRGSVPAIGGEPSGAVCEYEFEAAMRWLDMIGLKTGYSYKRIKPVLPWGSNIRNGAKDVAALSRYQQIAVPSTSADYCFSPNAYVKTSACSWTNPPAADSGDYNSGLRSVVKMKSKHHFVGHHAHNQHLPAELEQRCRELHEKRANALVDPGPSMKRSHELPILPPVSSSATVLVGAASRAIVKRSEQNNPTVYKSELASANPFVTMNLSAADTDDQTSLNGGVFGGIAFGGTSKNCQKGSTSEEDENLMTTSNGSKDNPKKKTSFRTPSFLKKRKGAKKENASASMRT